MGVLLQAVLACGVIFGVWYLYSRTVIKLPLRTLPGPAAASFWTGNLAQLFSPDGMPFVDGLAQMGGVVKVYGLMKEEQLFVSDPHALHHIFTKEGASFEEPDSNQAITQVVWGKGLSGVPGDMHKRQRKMLSPVFSVANLRSLVPILSGITDQLRDALASRVRTGESEVDILDWMSRAALEYIGIGGLGYSFDALREDADNAYGKASKALLPTLFPVLPFFLPLPAVKRFLSARTLRRLVEMTPIPTVQKLRNIIDTMHSAAEDIYEEKKRVLALGVDNEARLEALAGKGKDIITVLMRGNMAASENDQLPKEEVIAQMNLLLFAAEDTTSSSLTRTLQLLALHPHIQDKLRQEIEQIHEDIGSETPSYDQLMAMPFLDAVTRETLRRYAPAVVMTRTALKDTVLPLSEPLIGTDGRAITQVPVRKNQTAYIGISAVNLSPAIWGPDAATWNPDRWLSPLPESVAAARVPGVYSNLMTFLAGNRACIGFKFAELEMKMALYMLVYNFKFSPSETEVEWKMGTVMIPYVKGHKDGLPCLPIKLSLVAR